MSPERKTHTQTEDLLDRPLPARSLVASLLLRTRPPRMSGGRLVQWCGLFGVAEGTARVALSRMVERGELEARDGIYELAGRVGGRRPAQDWSLEPTLAHWAGDWRMAVVRPGPRTAGERNALRVSMRRIRFVPLREGVWSRPDNVPRASAPVDAWRVVDAQCDWWSGRPDEDSVVRAVSLFDPAGWSARAGELTRRLTGATRALGGSDAALAKSDAALAGGFVVGAAALAHIRADPVLPRELTPSPAAGEGLRDAYRSYEDAFSVSLRAWFRSR
jgi:phenylacetic acid degradation operon negative regulatory protein